jgi:hypothetical protein
VAIVEEVVDRIRKLAIGAAVILRKKQTIYAMVFLRKNYGETK